MFCVFKQSINLFADEFTITSKPKDMAKRIYSDSDSDDDIKAVINKSGTATKSKLRLYSDTVSEEEDDFEKGEHVKVEKVKTPEPNIDLEEIVQPPRTPGRETSPIESESKTPKTYDYDRIYSDSEEEREYQEKRRRNTEYMEQIEREFLEEQLKQQQTSIDDEETAEEDEMLPEKAPSPGDPSISSNNSKLPITPDVKLSGNSKSKISPLDEYASKKLPIGTKKTAKDSKTKGTNGLGMSETLEDDIHKGKLSPASCSSQESQTSQLSQVQLEHCYSLPPTASPVISPSSQNQTASIAEIIKTAPQSSIQSILSK